MNNISNQLHKNLKRLIHQYNLDLQTISKECNIPLSTLHDWQSAPSNPKDINALRRLSHFLGVTIDELVFSSNILECHQIKAKDINLTVFISRPNPTYRK